MKFKFSLAILLTSLVAVVVITSCNNSPYPDYEVSETGLYSRFYNKVEGGVQPKSGDVVYVVMHYKNDKDSVIWDSKLASRDGSGEIYFPIEEAKHKSSFEEGLFSMSVGDSASFKMVADSTFPAELPKGIEKGSIITFEVKLNKIMSKDDVEKERAKRMEEQKVMMELRKNEEPKAIEKYLSDNKINAKPTASGLIYVEKTKGKGPKPTAGKWVKVNYTGTLLDGTVFDTSNEAIAKQNGLYDERRPYEPIEFPLGKGQVIPGWDEGIALMPAGSKGIFIIPSAIAYGPQGGGPIPPYSPLVFEVELVSFGDTPPAAPGQ